MKTGALALALSAVALALGGYALTREAPPPPRTPVRMDRVADLEREVADLKRHVAALQAGRAAVRAVGIAPEATGTTAAPGEDGAYDAPVPLPGTDEALAAIVDDAVDRKTKQILDEMRVKANKKPAIDVFAKMLDLSDQQRARTERVVVEGQRRVHEILRTPTLDGTNLMDELVEIVALGMAQPGKDHGFGPWIARVGREKIPGTDLTYGAQIEAVKNEMRGTFRRDWSAAQYKEFEEWGVDPTEVQSVPGSPNGELWARITERAQALGAANGK